MRSLIVKVVEGGFFALLLVGGLFLVSRTWSQSTSGSVVVASPTPAQFSPEEQEVIDRAKQYLRDHAQEYRLRPDLSDLQVSRVDAGFGAMVGFRQLYAGYPVADTGVTVYFGPDGKQPISVASSYDSEIVVRNVTPPYPGPNAPTIGPTVSADDAAARAFTATGAKSRFQAPPAKAELVIWPVVQPGSKTVYTLAWDVQMITTDPYGNWGVTIDATTGEVLVKGNRFVPEPTGSNPQPFQSPAPIGPTPTFIPPTPVIIIGPAPQVNPLVTPTPPVPPPAVSPTSPALLNSPPPPIRLDPSKIITITTPTASPTTKSSLLAPDASPVVVRAPATAGQARTTLPAGAASASSSCSLSLVEGFEGSFPTACWDTRGSPTWGTTDWSDPADPPAYTPHGGQKSLWCAGNGRNAYNDFYADNMNAWAIYGPFDLTGLTWAQLHFYYWSRLQGSDFFSALASVDGSSFYQTMSQSGYTNGWQAGLIDLTNVPGLGNLTGRSSVWVALRFWSDASSNDWGTFVDDVSLEIRRANLTPYTPSGWASPLVPSAVTGIHYVDTLDANGSTYVDWAAMNNGNADTGPVYFGLYLDGTLLHEWYFDNLSPGTGAGPIEDWPISSPSPGWHWLKLVADSRGMVNESNEGDNVREEQFYWHSPDLAPYTPAGWSYPIVPSSSQGTNTVSDLFAGRAVWVDWAITNLGTMPASNFDVALYRDGTAIGWQHVEYLAPQEPYRLQDFYISGAPVLMDNHALKLVADTGNTMRESTESNNSYERSFTWRHHLGQVFDPNPVVTSGDTTLVDNSNQDSPALNNQLRTVNLLGLDASGSMTGSYADFRAPVPSNLLSTGCSTGQAYDPGFNFLYTRSDTRFEEVTPYYHIDAIARFLPSIGFTNIITRPIKVYPHCNVTGHYSQEGVIALGRINVDAGEDAEIVAHEVGHLIQFAQIGDWAQNNTEGGALGEGFGYYWSASYFSAKNPTTPPLTPAPVTFRTCMGEWAYSTGQANCMWPVISTKHYPEDMTANNDGHLDGQIWSAALWDIWTALGRATTDKMVLWSDMRLADPPQATRFGEGADAIIVADQQLNAGANRGTITNVFRQRGIFDGYELDNVSSDAKLFTVNGASQTHNLHSRSDVDWVKFTSTGFYVFSIETSNLQANADTIVELYESDGITLKASNDDCTAGSRTSCIRGVQLFPTTYYVRVRPKSDTNTGRNTNYNLSVNTTGTWVPKRLNLPLIAND